MSEPFVVRIQDDFFLGPFATEKDAEEYLRKMTEREADMEKDHKELNWKPKY